MERIYSHEKGCCCMKIAPSYFKLLNSVLSIFLIVFLCGCGKSKEYNKMIWDSGPIENFFHGGTFVGYVRIYTINWEDGTKKASDEQYRVYKKYNGDFIVDYNGDNYIIEKAAEPFGSGVYALKYRISYDHYIEDIPSSY